MLHQASVSATISRGWTPFISGSQREVGSSREHVVRPSRKVNENTSPRIKQVGRMMQSPALAGLSAAPDKLVSSAFMPTERIGRNDSKPLCSVSQLLDVRIQCSDTVVIRADVRSLDELAFAEVLSRAVPWANLGAFRRIAKSDDGTALTIRCHSPFVAHVVFEAISSGSTGLSFTARRVEAEAQPKVGKVSSGTEEKVKSIEAGHSIGNRTSIEASLSNRAERPNQAGARPSELRGAIAFVDPLRHNASGNTHTLPSVKSGALPSVRFEELPNLFKGHVRAEIRVSGVSSANLSMLMHYVLHSEALRTLIQVLRSVPNGPGKEPNNSGSNTHDKIHYGSERARNEREKGRSLDPREKKSALESHARPEGRFELVLCYGSRHRAEAALEAIRSKHESSDRAGRGTTATGHAQAHFGAGLDLELRSVARGYHGFNKKEFALVNA